MSCQNVIITPDVPQELRVYSKSEKSLFNVTISSRCCEVTGSCHIMEFTCPDGKYTVMLDCGNHQEVKYLEKRFSFKDEVEANKIDAVVISHSHDDHIGQLTTLVEMGYRGNIYCTEIAKDVSAAILEDGFNIQKRNTVYSENCVVKQESIAKTLKHMVVVKPATRKQILDGIFITLYDNDHLPGACYIYMEFVYGDDVINVLYTGDRKTTNLLFKAKYPIPKEVFENTQILIEEATNAATSNNDVLFQFESEIINHFKSGREMLIIGAFAQERSQLFGYLLYDLMKNKKIPNVPVYIDGKLQFKINEIYQKHHSFFDKVGSYNFDQYPKVVSEEVFWTLSDKEKANSISRSRLIEKSPKCIVISTSGMFSHGPIQEYLVRKLESEKTTFFVPGYCSEGTISRTLRDAYDNDEDSVSIYGLFRQLNAKCVFLNQFSGHDRIEDTLKFRQQFKNVKLDLIVHGNDKSRIILAKKINNSGDISSKDIVSLDDTNAVRFGKHGLVKIMQKKALI